MSELVQIRPGLALEKLAAESWQRMEDDLGRELDVNRSTVPREVQYGLFAAWNAWVGGYGPKPNHGRAIHPDDSWHCMPRARAVDTDDDEWIRQNPQYGWRFVVSDEKWHAQYYPEYDLVRGLVNTKNNEEDDMLVNIQGTAGKRNGGLYYIKDGQATFLGAAVAGVPSLVAAHADKLAKRVKGL